MNHTHSSSASVSIGVLSQKAILVVQLCEENTHCSKPLILSFVVSYKSCQKNDLENLSVILCEIGCKKFVYSLTESPVTSDPLHGSLSESQCLPTGSGLQDNHIIVCEPAQELPTPCLLELWCTYISLYQGHRNTFWQKSMKFHKDLIFF